MTRKLLLATIALTTLAGSAIAAGRADLDAITSLVSGVGNPHAFAVKEQPGEERPATDWRAWQDMTSRDPYPGMGVGNVH